MLRTPPDILITTPESLYLLLTSQAREQLRSVETLILDEVHAVAGTKRGAHLALSVERLERLVAGPLQRIGLSATQRPLEEIGRFVSGGRPIQLVDAGSRKELDLQVVVPVDDMRELASTAGLSTPILADGVEMGPGVERSSQSIWPSIYPEILRLVEAHRSTIVFVNNRRLAERLALRLNELAGRDLARAHHGSLAREQRVEVEELLKRGGIPCLVATSSLELGIDMGAVDLVIQVESPKSVARGLQRIGRAGHELGAVSTGRIFPKFRADLLESAVVAERMQEGEIEETVIPRNPLDVLAQQIVAICADEEITVDDLYDLVRRAYPFADLSRVQLENVLDMLAGRYPSDEFAELRPRIVWDRTGGVVRGRPGVRRLAVTNAGTIPDRGLFGVFLVEGGGRVGELDEEMVYEARAGQVFLLGASSWRIEEITRDRVLVSPAPGVPGAIPFWKGEGIGRPYELGEAIGRASRELVALSDEQALERLTARHFLDERAAGNLITFLREQAAATGAVPSDRTVVVERFRDEIGDWRVCILTPFGARVHAPWALALAARLRDSLGVEVQSLWSDDGIALHLPDADAPPPVADLAIGPDEIEELVVAGGGADRALRRPLPRERGPRPADPAPAARAAHAALAAAPQGAEPAAGRAPLRLVPRRARDLPRVPPGRLRPARAEAAPARAADPRGRPRRRRDRLRVALRGLAPLRLHRDLHVRGRHAAGGAACPGALARPRPPARAARPGGAARPARPGRARRRRGAAARGAPEPGRAARRAAAARRPARGRARPGARGAARRGAARGLGQSRGRGAPDRGRGRGPLPRRARRDAAERAARTSSSRAAPSRSAQLVLRFARGRGPFTTAEANARFGRDVEPELLELERDEKLVRGELRPGGTEREWCEPDVLRRLRRASLAALRREVEPAEQAALGRFLPHWHGIGRRATLREALVPLQGLPLPVSLWESDVLPRRVPGYRPEQLDALCASGELVWVGAGLDRVAVYFRDDAPVLGRPGAAPPPDGEAHERLRGALGRSAEFWYDLLAAAGLDAEAALPALWDLVWAGEVTNDAWTPLRAGRRYEAPRPVRAPAPVLAHAGHAAITATQGRWSPTARLFEGRARPPRARRAPARAPGDRDARRRARRGDSRRLRRRLRRAARARDARRVPPRLLRRGARRRAVRAARRGRAAARAARRATGRSPSALVLAAADPGAALRRRAAVAEALAGPRRARRGSAGRPARRRGRALRRARRPHARAAARSRRGVAPPGARGARRARPRGRREAPRGRALRRQAGDRERRRCRSSSRPASSPAPGARCCVPDRGGRGRRSRRPRRAITRWALPSRPRRWCRRRPTSTRSSGR